MNTINSKVEETIEIKKSRFICSLIPVNSVDEAKEKLNEVKHQYFDAKHHCYAYICGDKGEEIKFSDDGEPAQTAGIVIYNTLQNNNLTNVLCVVTRYFGGILLGAGGLTRAYSEASSKACKSSEIIEIIKYTNLSFTINYSYVTPVTKLLDKYKKINQSYETNVTLTYEVNDDDVDDIKIKLTELTNGTILFS